MSSNSRTERFSSVTFASFSLSRLIVVFAAFSCFRAFLVICFSCILSSIACRYFFSFVSALKQICILIMHKYVQFNLYYYLCVTRCKDSSDALACNFASLASLFNRRIDCCFILNFLILHSRFSTTHSNVHSTINQQHKPTKGTRNMQ